MAQDSTGPLAIRSLNEMGIDMLHDPSKALLVIDHTFPAADEKVANLHAMIRDFVSKHSCMIVEGSISHQHILEYFATPGMMLLGADSHTCQAGCVSAFACGIGSKIEIQPGSQAKYKDEFEKECDKIVPQVSGPDNVDKVHSVEELANVEIDQAFIGSSTNGRLEDLEIAARMLKGRKVHKNTRCVVTPASVKVYQDAIRRGYVEIYLESGAVFTNATCGACVGTHLGALGENEICISSSSRNFVGRMGALSSKVYLASPATVAASAIEGKIG